MSYILLIRLFMINIYLNECLVNGQNLNEPQTLNVQVNKDDLIQNNRKPSDFHDIFPKEPVEEVKPSNMNSNEPHSRQKRLIWITDDGRLALPPGTSLTITPTLALPLVRYPPDGFFSNISVSLPLTLDFDKLGLTDNQNPLGVLPPIFARHMGRAIGSVLNEYINKYLQRRSSRKSKRAVDQNEYYQVTSNTKENDPDAELMKLPDSHKHIFHGGERAILYTIVEDLLLTFGMPGRACLLRTICEVHSKNLDHFGLVGEMMRLFLTASQSPFSHLMEEYVAAEKIGKGEIDPGECFPFFKDCPKSLFQTASSNKYKQKFKNASKNKLENVSIPNKFM